MNVSKTGISLLVASLLVSGSFSAACNVDKTTTESSNATVSVASQSVLLADAHSSDYQVSQQTQNIINEFVATLPMKRRQMLIPAVEKRLTQLTMNDVRYNLLLAIKDALQTSMGNNGMMNIAELAMGTEDLSTLATIVQALDLGETLSSGEYTVFAPTNQAFANLLEALDMSFDELAANTDLLKSVLLYHVVEGSVYAKDVASLTEGTLVTTLNGESIRTSSRNGVFIDNSPVVTADVKASNGVVHIIDEVLVPPTIKMDLGMTTDRGAEDVVTTAINSEAFPTLVAAITAAGLADDLMADGPFTVYAPTEEAFGKLLADLDMTAEELLADTELLQSVLLYHVVPGFYSADDIMALESATMSPTLQGSTVTINNHDGSLMINMANIVDTDIFTSNGVIHVIDAVLLP